MRHRGTLLVATIAVTILSMSTASTAATAQTRPAGADDEVATGEPPVPTIPNYVATTTVPGRSLDVSAFSPDCIRDVPYIVFSIVPKGFTSSGPATLTFSDVNGNLVEQVTTPTLSGQIIYPGATAGPNGDGLDWPGWKRADDGSWTPDPSDAVLREGLEVVVEVDGVSATTSVRYVPSDAPCANPPRTTPPAPPLARTGGGVGSPLIIGAAALLAGLTMVGAARRRRRSRHPLPS
jgi:hypothetical protein